MAILTGNLWRTTLNLYLIPRTSDIVMKQFIKYLPIAFLALLLASCSEHDDEQDETFDTHTTWNDSNPSSFWDKQTGGNTTISLTP